MNANNVRPGSSRMLAIAGATISFCATSAYGYMGPGAGTGGLPGVGLAGIVVALLLTALGALALLAVAALCFAVGRRCAGWWKARHARPGTDRQHAHAADACT